MKNVLIIYPASFKSYSKFCRKVLRITENLGDMKFASIHDNNLFLKKIVSEHFPNVEVILDENVDLSSITHAIIFDDGEEFPGIIEEIKKIKVPLRFIKIDITRVVNINTESQYDTSNTESYEYIGRGSYWGNPYSMYDLEDLEEGENPRDVVIQKFKYDFDYDKFLNVEKNQVYKLAGKRLGCFCKPQACHGDVLADFLNSWDDGK